MKKILNLEVLAQWWIHISHPVMEHACACERGPNVSDKGNVLQFGEEEQQ